MSGQKILGCTSARFAAAFMACLLGSLSTAKLEAAVQVDGFGDYGWKSDDTRDDAGNNLVGINNTNAGKPGQVPAAADDIAISNQIKFVAGPAGSTYGGAVSIDGMNQNAAKSNISVITGASTGFGPGGLLVSPGFSAQYEWYGQPNPTSRTLAFKIGVQSANWALSQAGFTAQRSGESLWDLVLVHIPAASDNVWSTVSVDHDSGTWNLFRQAGNAYFPVPGAPQTLDNWFLDPTFGPALFGTGSKITSVQFGLGSSQRQSIAYVDYLQTSLLHGGDVIDFKAAGTAAVPEATSILVWSVVTLAVGGATWFRRQRLLA